ncbi:MAG: hypothetical protein FJW23_01450 [Acidimicrobiia bacterium]|nr:hypothetical protein [Acidimicrobiia bacterium]
MSRRDRPGQQGRRATALASLLIAAVLAAGCGASRAYGRGDQAGRNGDWDAAVLHFREAVQKEPNRAEYRIALERAMINAAGRHLDQARVFEARGQLDEALREYRRANEFDPVSRSIADKVRELERRIREQLEAELPKPTIDQLRERARQEGPQPLLNLESTLPTIRFVNTSVRDILNFIGDATNINVTYDRDFQDRSYTVELDDVTLNDALNQILTVNQYFYKVVNDRTILVVPDTNQKRAQYEEQVIQTFFISHADATELAQLLVQVIRLPSMAVPPRIVPNKAANTITVGASANVVEIVEKLIEQNDNPRAEVVVDVQILEVNRSRAKQFGLDLSSYAVRGVFSPERNPAAEDATDTFNLNTITRGVNTGDFYLAIPSAIVSFLENDDQTKLIAKPQLRGQEGQLITLNLGDEVPVPSTVFTPFAQGGVNVNPLTSFTYRTVGVVVEMTPRVTFEDEIILELSVESSSLGPGVVIGSTDNPQTLPSFFTRKVNTRLRLRNGESNLLAGLLQERERTSAKGFPGLLRLPIIRNLFGNTSDRVEQTDIVMLLTPRLVRTHELTQDDVAPIYIGSQQNLALGGPPPTIGPGGLPDPQGTATPQPPGTPPATDALPPPPAVAPQTGAPAAQPVIPPGSNTVPGTTQPAGGGTPVPSAQRQPVPPAQILLTAPANELQVGGGPYTVPISVSNASRLSMVSITLTFDPSVLRVRSIQEGSFMRQGGTNVQFTQQVDPVVGRIDIAIVRTGDAAGASGSGLLSAILFDAAAPGFGNFTMTGSATLPDGTVAPLTFVPAVVTVR